MSFKTRKSQYQLNRTRQKLLYKDKKVRHWNTLTYDKITGVHFIRNTDITSLIEFLFSDYNLFDFKKKYRDRLHTYDIKLRVDSDHPDINMDVMVLSLKQFAQKEFYLGQLMHDFDIWLMTKLGFYLSIDDVYKEHIKQVRELFNECGLELSELTDVRSK